MKEIRYLSSIFVIISLLASCKKIEQLPAVPHIDFTSFTIFDTLDPLGNISKGGRLKFKFEDGDGDIGLNSPTIGVVDSTNLFLTLYRKKQGSMVAVSSSLDPLLPYTAYRIPYMERLGQNKILKGTISVVFIYQSYSPTDTIKYDFFIEDRALNQSNVASTSEIVPSVNKIYQ
jgi:hypothetical protein